MKPVAASLLGEALSGCMVSGAWLQDKFIQVEHPKDRNDLGNKQWVKGCFSQCIHSNDLSTSLISDKFI